MNMESHNHPGIIKCPPVTITKSDVHLIMGYNIIWRGETIHWVLIIRELESTELMMICAHFLHHFWCNPLLIHSTTKLPKTEFVALEEDICP